MPPEAAAEAAADLARRLRSGDERALEEVYDRHARTTFSLAYAILRDPHDAEDAVARAFAQLWNLRRRYDPDKGALEGWIHMLVRSRALDLLRARRRRLRVVADVADDGEPPATDLPSRPVERLHAERLVGTTLGRLSAEQRDVIELAYFEGMTQSEIAERLDLPLGTVKTRTRAALTKLRDVLEAQEPTGR